MLAWLLHSVIAKVRNGFEMKKETDANDGSDRLKE
jgi:hypothetical protein